MEMDQILEGLRNLQQAPMRGQIVRFQGGFTIIDDSYNSNPRALCRMIDTLAAAISFRRRILVAGEMLELGPTSESLHYECGVLAAQRGLDIVVGVQGAAREIVRGATETGIPESRALFFSQVEPAGDFVSREVHEGDLVLIKGSRGVHLEKIVQDLRSHFTQRVG
jgi:UDP-N-acetylmuramoyl-tripeptide--D-alanyl-D-alanine ligase